MRSFLAVTVLGLVLTSGCIALAQEPASAQDMVATIETSMLPDFGTSNGPAYRMVRIHQHVMPSPEEERENSRGGGARVVCFRLDGLTPSTLMDSGSSEADMAAAKACFPTLDEGRGRLFANRTILEQKDPLAVVVLDTCSGHFLPILREEPGFSARAPAHTFRLEFLANDTLLVDGRWHVEPRHTLKIEYVAQGPKAGGDDDRRVKFVVDYAGFWLYANVAPYDPSEPVHPRPTEGTGPQAWIPRQPARLADILDPLVAAEPQIANDLRALRLTALDGRLTDVHVQLQSAPRVINWFLAGGNETHVHMLGAETTDASRPNVRLESFKQSFASVDLAAILAKPSAMDAVEVQWAPWLGLESRSPVAWAETWLPSEKCETDCAWVWTAAPGESPKWRLAVDPKRVDREDAMTLLVSLTRDAETVPVETFHRP